MAERASDGQAAVPGEGDLGVLRRLPGLLLREGYVDAYLVFGTLHTRFDEVQRSLEALPAPTRTLLRLLFLNEAVAAEEVAAVFEPAELAALQRLGVLLARDDTLQTGRLILLPAFGHFLFVMAPSTNPIAYFGDDSRALAVRVQPPRGARCLDLCAGTGLQALRASGMASHVVAIEIHPMAVACAELNVVMNGLEDRVDVRRGDLYAALAPDERFDHVVANPPLLPFPTDLPYALAEHGGADGLAITRRILDGLPARLRDGGSAQLIGSCLGDAAGPHPRGELARTAAEKGWRITFTLPTRAPLRPGEAVFERLVDTSAALGAPEGERATVAARLAEHLSSLGADHLYLYYMTVTTAAARPGLSVTTHYRRPGGVWFR